MYIQLNIKKKYFDFKIIRNNFLNTDYTHWHDKLPVASSGSIHVPPLRQ